MTGYSLNRSNLRIAGDNLTEIAERLWRAWRLGDGLEMLRLWKVSGDRVDQIAGFLTSVEVVGGPADYSVLSPPSGRRPRAGHYNRSSCPPDAVRPEGVRLVVRRARRVAAARDLG